MNSLEQSSLSMETTRKTCTCMNERSGNNADDRNGSNNLNPTATSTVQRPTRRPQRPCDTRPIDDEAMSKSVTLIDVSNLGDVIDYPVCYACIGQICHNQILVLHTTRQRLYHFNCVMKHLALRLYYFRTVRPLMNRQDFVTSTDDAELKPHFALANAMKDDDLSMQTNIMMWSLVAKFPKLHMNAEKMSPENYTKLFIKNKKLDLDDEEIVFLFSDLWISNDWCWNGESRIDLSAYNETLESTTATKHPVITVYTHNSLSDDLFLELRGRVGENTCPQSCPCRAKKKKLSALDDTTDSTTDENSKSKDEGIKFSIAFKNITDEMKKYLLNKAESLGCYSSDEPTAEMSAFSNSTHLYVTGKFNTQYSWRVALGGIDEGYRFIADQFHKIFAINNPFSQLSATGGGCVMDANIKRLFEEFQFCFITNLIGGVNRISSVYSANVITNSRSEKIQFDYRVVKPRLLNVKLILKIPRRPKQNIGTVPEPETMTEIQENQPEEALQRQALVTFQEADGLDSHGHDGNINNSALIPSTPPRINIVPSRRYLSSGLRRSGVVNPNFIDSITALEITSSADEDSLIVTMGSSMLTKNATRNEQVKRTESDENTHMEPAWTNYAFNSSATECFIAPVNLQGTKEEEEIFSSPSAVESPPPQITNVEVANGIGCMERLWKVIFCQ